MKKGKLYLIPTTLGDDALHTIPSYVVNVIQEVEEYIVERSKTARRFLKAAGIDKPLNTITIHELDKHNAKNYIDEYLQNALKGKDIGLLSEAGCPGVADPGAEVVALAHQKGIEVVPLVGPSSILLALMASGMNGQQFTFYGYLPPKTPERTRALKKLEQSAPRVTSIFIETPYRNQQMIESMLNNLSPNTRLCIAADITLPTEYIITKTVSEWKKTTIPNLHKRPTIFLIG
ncbi:MAG: 16S rRNA (cytidine1402-2'-O)-methyltransferase [Cognaticolwellia sp.]|jgi:16S rRNA (cytidine1402-2'-O)-methyltransferase